MSAGKSQFIGFALVREGHAWTLSDPIRSASNHRAGHPALMIDACHIFIRLLAWAGVHMSPRRDDETTGGGCGGIYDYSFHPMT
jgi:hypothetical protein